MFRVVRGQEGCGGWVFPLHRAVWGNLGLVGEVQVMLVLSLVWVSAQVLPAGHRVLLLRVGWRYGGVGGVVG